MSAASGPKRVLASDWPALPYQDWGGTIATLHRWLQIAGKVRTQLSPWVNHSWSTTLYVTTRGLTTSPIPFGALDLQIDFDFIGHVLLISTSNGHTRRMELRPRTVAEFYAELFRNLRDLGIDVTIYPSPNEVPDPIPFAEDTTHATYEPAHAAALWQAFRNTARVMGEFRARFLGKDSPIHLFWGAPDLAVTRFSGRRAPEHKGGIPHLPDAITRDAYSHEVSSCGFWPGNADAPEPSFYAYAYPTPDGFSEATVEPYSAFWHKDLGEFILPYNAVRASDTPDETLQRFFQTTYEAAANLAGWDREALEQPLGFRPIAKSTS
jgi:hypothetical protein